MPSRVESHICQIQPILFGKVLLASLRHNRPPKYKIVFCMLWTGERDRYIINRSLYRSTSLSSCSENWCRFINTLASIFKFLIFMLKKQQSLICLVYGLYVYAQKVSFRCKAKNILYSQTIDLHVFYHRCFFLLRGFPHILHHSDICKLMFVICSNIFEPDVMKSSASFTVTE